MSRTKRKPAWYVEHSDVSYTNRVLARQRQKLVKKKRTAEELAQAQANAQKFYQREIAENFGSTTKSVYSYYHQRWVEVEIRPPHVPKYRYEIVGLTVEEQIAEAKLDRQRFTRDGNMSETGRRSGYKRASTKLVRREWRCMEHNILKDLDYDQFNPSDHIGKQLIWDYW